MSGFRGVFQLKNCNRYRVDIGFKGKRYYVGLLTIMTKRCKQDLQQRI